MSKILIAYESRYGSTRQYAEWIGEALKADVRRAGDVKPVDLLKYDSVVVGGYARMGRFVGAEFVTRHWEALKEKKDLLIFSCSGMPTDSVRANEFFEKSFKGEIREKARYFPLPGRLVKLNFADSVIMMFPKLFMRLSVLMGNDTYKDALALLNGFDRMDKSKIKPIVEALS
jgi:menaquinone-dependent protoporphyrinogen IX oxidase